MYEKGSAQFPKLNRKMAPKTETMKYINIKTIKYINTYLYLEVKCQSFGF